MKEKYTDAAGDSKALWHRRSEGWNECGGYQEWLNNARRGSSEERYCIK